ncbi:MAG: lytic murein transglycosylase B [Burkholderiales bacterium]|nr:lytic murein transglycosylase B [Burkholderiales bacterium]
MRTIGAIIALVGALGLIGAADAAANASPGGRVRLQHDKAAASPSYRTRQDVLRFAAEAAARRGWDPHWVRDQLADARRLTRVTELIMPPPAGTPKNWTAYRDRFVEPRRIEAGVRFRARHGDLLQRAERIYGVPPEIVVGIIGVETFYGRMMGGFRVIDALATLAFDFPRGRSDRSAFFRDELEELLALAHREGLRADTLRGSYAGAIGWPQFMPGSINRHAVDFDGDGHIDLRHSVADAIGSVAHFLQQHGWQRGMPTHFEVRPPDDAVARATLLAPDIEPRFSAQDMHELGAELAPAAAGFDGPLALVEVHNGAAAPSHVAGTQNFYVLTRYNRSSYYARAVIALGQAVSAAHEATTTGADPAASLFPQPR